MLVDVPAKTAAARSGKAICVVPLDVPAAIFDSEATQAEPVLNDIRNLVYDRPGYMQLSPDIADINLGDSGALYVFEGLIFTQCH